MLIIIFDEIKMSSFNLPYRIKTYAQTMCFSLSSTKLWIGLITAGQGGALQWDSDCSLYDETMTLYFPPGTSHQKCWTLYPLTGLREPKACDEEHAFLCEVWQGKQVR